MKSLKHRSAFNFWYGLSVHSCSKVAEKFKVSPRTVRRWKLDEDWEKRAELRDREVDERTDEVAIDTVAEMNIRHIKEALKGQKRAWEELINLDSRSSSEAMKIFESWVNIERKARGEPTEIKKEEIEMEADINYEFTDEEFKRAYERIFAPESPE